MGYDVFKLSQSGSNHYIAPDIYFAQLLEVEHHYPETRNLRLKLIPKLYL